jgi:hypothetical protein
MVLKRHFSIIFPSKPRSSKWSHFFWFLHQIPAWISLLPHACPTSSAPHTFWFDYRNNSFFSTRNHGAPHYAVFPASCCFIQGPNTLLWILLSAIHGLAYVLSLMIENNFHIHTKQQTYILNFTSVDSKSEDKRF